MSYNANEISPPFVTSFIVSCNNGITNGSLPIRLVWISFLNLTFMAYVLILSPNVSQSPPCVSVCLNKSQTYSTNDCHHFSENWILADPHSTFVDGTCNVDGDKPLSLEHS